MDREFLFIGLAMTVLGLAGIAMEPLSPTYREGFTALAGLVAAFGIILIPVGILKGGVPTGRAPKLALAVTGIVILASVEALGVLNIGGFIIGGQVPTTTTVPPAPQKVAVSMILGSVLPTQPDNYIPKDVVVVLGVNNTVIWTTDDNAAHTVTSVTAGLFDSGNMNPGDVWEYTFTQTGTFNYICTYHPWMKGSVRVISG